MSLKQKYWFKVDKIINYLHNYCSINNYKNILDVGAGPFPFELATHIIDVNSNNSNKYVLINIDIENIKIPFKDNFFDFCYSRHTLEDLGNPQFPFYEMIRVSINGFIETPSPLVELCDDIDCDFYVNNKKIIYRGYFHHRYIVWTTRETNTLNFLPKYPIIDKIEFNYDDNLKSLLNKEEYWNNYYFWDKNNLPKIKIFRNDIDFIFNNNDNNANKYNYTYSSLLDKAIYESIDNTEFFINNKLK